MKNIILISILVLSNIMYCQESFNERALIKKSNQIIKAYSSQIHTTEIKDTTYLKVNFLKMTRSYGEDKNLIKRININPRSSLGFSGPRTEIYDAKGNIIVAKNEDIYGEIWYLSINEYDDSGNLRKQTLFDPKFIYTKLYEYDSENKLSKVSFYDSKGHNVKSEKRAKRKKPYTLK
ncbi:hypothetical protein [Psychroserpens sp. MEBiC05023]